MNAKPTLVIMAAGMGSRYGDLKQIDSVGPSGETIMDYSIFDAARAGFGKAVFVIRPDLEKTFRTAILPKYDLLLEVALAFQTQENAPASRKKPWGTGHAVLSARDEVATPFALINADDFYGHRSYRLLADFLTSSASGIPSSYAMVGYRLANTLSEHGFVSRGVCATDETGDLSSIVERVHVEKTSGGLHYLEGDQPRPLTGDEIVSLNFWGLQPSIFPHLERLFSEFLASTREDPKAEFFFPSVVDRLIREGSASVKVLPTEDSWFGLTYREDKGTAAARIADLIGRGVYPSKLFNPSSS